MALEDLGRADRRDPLPTILAGTVHSTADGLRVVVPTLDGGRRALSVFGTPPVGAAAGDPVRVSLDEAGTLVLIAWEASP